MCSSNVSDTANILRNKRQSNPTAVPPFRSGHMSAICARLRSKGKVGVQRGRETAGVPSFLPPRRAPRRSRRPQTANPLAEVQRKTLRPSGANTLTQFEYPAQPVQRNRLPPGKDEPPARFKCPRGSVQKLKSSTLFRVLLRITNAYAFLINASRRSRPLSISVSEVA